MEIDVSLLENEKGALAAINEYSDTSNPKYIGPGIWVLFHKEAYAADTHEKQLQYIDLVHRTADTFNCHTCQVHFKEYLKEHPMEEYLDVSATINGEKKLLGMFVWAWKFHNVVNKRLNKPIMSWVTAHTEYSGGSEAICSKECTDADTQAVFRGKPNITSIPSSKILLRR
jgi:hypothetical protein